MESNNTWLARLLSMSSERPDPESMAEWFRSFSKDAQGILCSVERAMIGGRFSPNLAYAFASGYQSAIEYLFKFSEPQLASFCVTETGKNHPRAIETKLEKHGDIYVLNGHKSFVSGACDAQRLYVACRLGEQDDGRPNIKLVCLPSDLKGVEVTAMPPLPFIPEVSHGTARFSGVEISPELLMPGDGYLEYVKPFRTIEDLHVQSAAAAFLLGEAIVSGWGREPVELISACLLSMRGLADLPLKEPASHIALAGIRQNFMALIESTDTLFEANNPAGYQNWLRDKALLNIAAKAHGSRTQKAWDLIGG